MMSKHLRTRPKMKWLVMDALAMKARVPLGPLLLVPAAAPACVAQTRNPLALSWCPQFADGSFDVVFDKGALDAFMGESGPSATQAVSTVVPTPTVSSGRLACPSVTEVEAHMSRSFEAPTAVCLQRYSF